MFTKEAADPMIVRWYMALSEFSYTLEFIPVVAMSRLCRNNMIDQPQVYSKGYILSSIVVEEHGRKPNDQQFRKIGKIHNSKVGHFGLERTLQRFETLEDIWRIRYL